MRLDDVCLVNAEVTASDDFYREGLGLPRRMRNVRFVDFDFGAGPRLALWMRPSIAETVGVGYPAAAGLPFRLTLELADAAAVEAAAARVPSAVRLTAPGGASYAVADPDGFVTVLRPSRSGQTRVAEIELAVSDPVRSYDFLERLGFRPAGRDPRVAFDGRMHFDGGGGVTITVTDAATVSPETMPLSEYAAFTRTGGHLMLAVELDSGAAVDALYADLKSRGLQDSGPPAVYEWGARSAYFVDADGYIWEIYAWVETPR